MNPSRTDRFARFIYRFRWPLAAAMLATVFGLAGFGMNRIMRFTAGVESLQEGDQRASPPPRMFDARYDIWFDPADSGLRTYQDVEAQFIAEDTVLVAFQETEHPWGIFSPRALGAIARLTEKIEQIPYVRHVRSLTASPWIRWAEAGPGEEGLVVTDLFEDDPSGYSKAERLERMIAVLGARRAARLAGEQTVRDHLGGGANFDDYIGEPRLVPGVISEDGRTTAIQVQILRDKIDDEVLAATFPDDANGKAIAPSMHANESQWAALAGIEKAMGEDLSGYEFHLAGMPVLERNFMTVGMGDMRYVGLMFGVIALVLLILFRRASGVLLPLVVVLSAIMGMEGAVWLAGDLINNLTAIAPNMITAIGIADAVHLVAAYYLLRPDHDDKRELITAVLRRNAVPVLLTSLTTAVGFFSLVTSEIVPMRMLGYTGGIGAIFAYLISMTTVPALLSLLPLRPSRDIEPTATPLRPQTERAHWTDKLVPFVLRNRRIIAVASLAAVAVAIVGVARVQITSDFREMFPDTNRMVIDQDFIEANLAGTGDLEIVFHGPEPTEDGPTIRARQARIDELHIQQLSANRALSPDEDRELADLRAREAEHQRQRIGVSHAFLQEVARFEERILSEAGDSSSPLRIITRIESPLDVLRKMNQVQNANRAADYRVPGPDDVPPSARSPHIEVDDVTEEVLLVPAQSASSLASQYYVQYESGAKPGENLSRILSADRRGFRLAASIDQADSSTQLAAFGRIREVGASEFPTIAGGMTMTGKLYLFANMIDRFTYSLIVSLTLALSVVTLLIGLFFRSVKLALVSLVPNVLPLVLPLGALGLVGIPLDGPAVLVVAVALGVCVDDTIHFFSKFYDARKSGSSLEHALRSAFRQVGSALTATTTILVAGFGVLILSDFRPNMLIGQLAIVMIGLAWIADFIVTPALLSLIERAPSNRDKETTWTTDTRYAA
jgi:predicted RND superfamily exporter protein